MGCCPLSKSSNEQIDDYKILSNDENSSQSPNKRVLFQKIFGDEDHSHPFEKKEERKQINTSEEIKRLQKRGKELRKEFSRSSRSEIRDEDIGDGDDTCSEEEDVKGGFVIDMITNSEKESKRRISDSNSIDAKVFNYFSNLLGKETPPECKDSFNVESAIGTPTDPFLLGVLYEGTNKGFEANHELISASDSSAVSILSKTSNVSQPNLSIHVIRSPNNQSDEEEYGNKVKLTNNGFRGGGGILIKSNNTRVIRVRSDSKEPSGVDFFDPDSLVFNSKSNLKTLPPTPSKLEIKFSPKAEEKVSKLGPIIKHLRRNVSGSNKIGSTATGLKKIVHDIDLQVWKEKQDNIMRIEWFGKRMLSSIHGANVYHSHPSLSKFSSSTLVIVEKIISILTHKMWRKGPSTHFSVVSDSYRMLLCESVENQRVIVFAFPSFPCKTWNPLKVTRQGCDLSEVFALLRLHSFAKAIFSVYKKGVRINIITDGIVLSPLFKEKVEVSLQYRLQLESIIMELKLDDVIEIIDMGSLILAEQERNGGYTFTNLYNETKAIVTSFWEKNSWNILNDSSDNSVFQSIFTNFNLVGKNIVDLRAIFFEDEEHLTHAQVEMVNDLKKEVETCCFNYILYTKTLERSDILKKAFPNALLLSATPKLGSLCFKLISNKSLLPWNGVAVVSSDKKVHIMMEEQVKCDNHYRAVFVNGDSSPFYYEQLSAPQYNKGFRKMKTH